jgi:hypothetical protein
LRLKDICTPSVSLKHTKPPSDLASLSSSSSSRYLFSLTTTMDRPTASPLCDQCWHLLEVIEAEGNKCDFKVRWHRSLYFECALCAALPLGVSSTIPYTVIGYEHPKEQLINLRFFPWKPVRGLHIVSFAVCRVQDDETLFSLSHKAALEDNTGHDSVLKVASEWTSRCTSRHDRCVKNERPQY